MRIAGIHSVTLALQNGNGQRLIVEEGRTNQRQQAVMDIAEQVGCPVVRESITGSDLNHQGVLLEVSPPKIQTEANLSDWLKGVDSESLVLVLDGVTDPRNFGACIRSAAGFGVDCIVVPKDNSAPLNEAAVRTASGGASLVPVYQVTNLARALDQMKAVGFWVVGTVLDDVPPLQEVDLTGNKVIIMGSEDSGMRQKTRKTCDLLASIPMPGSDLSLNVAVATGICLYEASRQRGA